jgi:hypothetical protein
MMAKALLAQTSSQKVELSVLVKDMKLGQGKMLHGYINYGMDFGSTFEQIMTAFNLKLQCSHLRVCNSAYNEN